MFRRVSLKFKLFIHTSLSHWHRSKSSDNGVRFSNRKMAGPLDSNCYRRQQAAAERPTSWMGTQVYSNVAPRPTRSRQSARLSATRLQSAGAGSGLETREKRTRRAPLRGYVLSSSQAVSQRAGLRCFIVSKHKIPRHVDSSALGTSPRRQTRGCQGGLGRSGPSALGASLRGARPRQSTVGLRRPLESLYAQQIRYTYIYIIYIYPIYIYYIYPIYIYYIYPIYI